MNFSEAFLTELVERNDIAEVVSGYVRLGRKSGANQFGLCPFHSEKTPSFSVSTDKQIYHCFGCGKGGGVINFIMEIENLSFPEAVEFLAKRCGLPLPEQSDDREAKHRKRLLELNREAARFFYEQLSLPEGAAARAYMEKRGIDRRTATNFGIGCASDAWTTLCDAMRRKGYSDRELFDAGLARKGKKGGYYDVFRNRLMFPVIDVRGNVIGFSGRILGDGEPKYMNTPETAVFDKGRNLFALNLAKKSKSGYILLTEGNIDVVSLHQAGFDSAVASLGTSLTQEQARLLSRFTKEIILCYDNDNAGSKASQRAIGILEKLDLKVRILRLSGAKDPDEFIQRNGAEAFRRLIEGSEGQLDFRLGSIAAKYNLEESQAKVDFLREATHLLAQIPSPVERQVYAMRVAAMTGVKDDVVIAEADRQHKRLRQQNYREENRKQRPVAQLQPGEKELRYENPDSAVAEEGVIRLLFLDPSLARRAALPAPEDFSSPILAEIYRKLTARIAAGESVNTAVMGAVLTPQEMNLLVKLTQTPELLSSGEQALADYIKRIREQKLLANAANDLTALAQRYKETKGYED